MNEIRTSIKVTETGIMIDGNASDLIKDIEEVIIDNDYRIVDLLKDEEEAKIIHALMIALKHAIDKVQDKEIEQLLKSIFKHAELTILLSCMKEKEPLLFLKYKMHTGGKPMDLMLKSN